ncbi:hypothetical protein GE21DRAFT_10417 [Neurospora crassa]|uniref:Uncharacterized protein n=1 Tax=Neurospora crassa (strain ATCC 24698 / 74-OR23-1A / CBS 708.71 / DSM 1257 / FGSC 987) TaxID=367110 RepID=Q7S578_NEUCR|nr:hypothetical protein NCU02292 [Neurospora crassa OR74A]EAA30700.3 hypothetical protein NCU02292 [Neurospora crassa OR74A]KHE84831.1 hypothetical protein GE21DRAFT_10417 [Neurospora crassa]|eukprot:XP_959936.3 hypothetical protein NCU02292 [Neurospora crassa OR74A]
MYDDLRKNELDAWELPSPLLPHPYLRQLPPLPSTLSRRGTVSENDSPADVPYVVGGLASVAAVQLLRSCLRNTPEFHKSQTPTSLNNPDINLYLLRKHEAAQSDMSARLATCVWTSSTTQLQTDTVDITIWGTKSTGTDGAFSSRPESTEKQEERPSIRRMVTPDISSILHRGSTPNSFKSQRCTSSEASRSNGTGKTATFAFNSEWQTQDGLVKWNEGAPGLDSSKSSRSPDGDLGRPASPGQTQNSGSRKQSLDTCSCPDLGRDEDEEAERPDLPRRRTDGPNVDCPHHHFKDVFQRSQSVCPCEPRLDIHRVRDPRSRRRLNREDVGVFRDLGTGAAGPLSNAPAQEYSPKLLAIAGVMIATGELDRLSLGSSGHSRRHSLSQVSQISVSSSKDTDEEEELPPLPPTKTAVGRRKRRAMSMAAPLSSTPFSFVMQAGKSGLSPTPTRRSSTGNQLWAGHREAPLPPVNSPALQQTGVGKGATRPGTGTPTAQGPFGSSLFRAKRPASRRLSEIWNASWDNGDQEDDEGDESPSEKQSSSPGLYDLESPRFTGAREDDVSPGGGANAETPRLSWPPNLNRVDQCLREQGEYFGRGRNEEDKSTQEDGGSPGWTETEEGRGDNLTLQNDGDSSDGYPSDTSPSTCECTHCGHAGYYVMVTDDAVDRGEHEVQLDEDVVGGVMQRSGSTQTIIHTPTRHSSQEAGD